MSLPRVSDEAAFRAALDPHMERMRLAIRFMRMDVAWSGEEAAEFADLLTRLCTWNDQDAPQKIHDAKARVLDQIGIDVDIGDGLVEDDPPDIFTTEMAPIIDLLRACSTPGMQARWPAEAVPTLLGSVDLMLDRAYLLVPLHIMEINAMANP